MSMRFEVVRSALRSRAKSEPDARLMAEISPLEFTSHARYGVKRLPVWREDCSPSGPADPFELRPFEVGLFAVG